MEKHPVPNLARSPLVFVLAQVRFPSVLKMDDHVAEIQDRLRTAGFPKFIKEESHQFVFGPEIKTERGFRWVFLNRKTTEAVVLTQDFVIYETTTYTEFDDFVGQFSSVIDVIGPQAKIDFGERIGLRFVDLIRHLDGNEPNWFLKECLRGLEADNFGASTCKNQSIATAMVSHGELFIRSFESSGPAFMPPDLKSTRLSFDLTLGDDETYRILDFDHISKQEFDFESDVITTRLWELHEYIGRAFRSAVTEEAIAAWQKE